MCLLSYSVPRLWIDLTLYNIVHIKFEMVGVGEGRSTQVPNEDYYSHPVNMYFCASIRCVCFLIAYRDYGLT